MSATQLELDLPTPPRDPHAPTHLLMPSMGLACGLPFLDVIGSQGQGHHFSFGAKPGQRWANQVTCDHCRAAGSHWYRWACRVMQGIDPLTRERRNTDPERALLAGIDQQTATAHANTTAGRSR